MYLRLLLALISSAGAVAPGAEARFGARETKPNKPMKSRYADSPDCPTLESHSQHGADFMLLPILQLATAHKPGTFVELGALNGVRFSNTLMLERCFGWGGLLIEASRMNFHNLKTKAGGVLRDKKRTDRVHSAVCEPAGTLQMRRCRGEVCQQAEGNQTALSGYQAVPCAPLREIMASAPRPLEHATFLSLDVEGAEEQVIRTVRPRAFEVIFVEMDGKDAAKDQRVHDYILDDGMVWARYWNLGSNRLYIKPHLAVAPCGDLCYQSRQRGKHGTEMTLQEWALSDRWTPADEEHARRDWHLPAATPGGTSL